jgi:hypothetical protein
VYVEYEVTGSAGDWTLDFSVTNNIGLASMNIYFFGVVLDARDIVGSPPGWDPNAWTTWDNSPYGGSSLIYNNIWIGGSIPNGGTTDGFEARVTTADYPVGVNWFAFAVSGDQEEYWGDDAFYKGWNPGFEGRAMPVPEPATVGAMLLGLGALIARRRR